MKLLRAYAMSLHGKCAHLMSETNDISAIFGRPARFFVLLLSFILIHFLDVIQCRKMI